MAKFNLTGDRSVFDRIKTKKVEMMYTQYDDGITEINFIVNGYKLHLDDMERFQIKKIVKEKYLNYRSVIDPEEMLKKDVPDSPPLEEGPKWIDVRSHQIKTLIRTLIWQLRNTKRINKDLEMLFGTSDWDPMFPNMLALFSKGTFVSMIKKEWEEDYLEVFKKEQIEA